MSEPLLSLAPGVVVAGRYRLTEPLAEGGMGQVWIAHHVDLDVRVAVKFLRSHAAERPTASNRFRLEAQAAARLRSPHIVQVHDFGVWQDTPYLAMELLEGETLRTRLDREQRLPLGEVAKLIQQAGKALSTAHAANIVHRDLKPSNLFLTRSGDDTVVKVIDFGIAKVIGPLARSGDDLTSSRELLGSPCYMSPEQARSLPLDGRSDVWALGVIAFEALCGHVPFEGNSPTDTLLEICTKAAPKASALSPALPVAIDAFFDRALCRKVDERFQTPIELANALSALAEAAPLAGASGASPSTRSVQARSSTTNNFEAPRFTSSVSVTTSRSVSHFVAPMLGALLLAIGVVGWRARSIPHERAPTDALVSATQALERTTAAVAAATVPPAESPTPAPEQTLVSQAPPPPQMPIPNRKTSSATRLVVPASARPTSTASASPEMPPPPTLREHVTDPLFGLHGQPR